MKKIISVVVLCLLLLSTVSVNVFAADSTSIDFWEQEWSMESQYPDWYGGRYLDNGQMTYVVVEGYESQAEEVLKQNRHVLKKYSYNQLMITLYEITNEWMGAQSPNETVCLQSASLDEINNCISIELYTGSDKVDSMKQALYERYGNLVVISTTDDIIEMVGGLEQQNNYWLFVSVALIVIMGMFIISRQPSVKVALQTANGNVIDGSRKISRAETVAAIKLSTITPNDEVFGNILKDI